MPGSFTPPTRPPGFSQEYPPKISTLGTASSWANAAVERIRRVRASGSQYRLVDSRSDMRAPPETFFKTESGTARFLYRAKSFRYKGLRPRPGIVTQRGRS